MGKYVSSVIQKRISLSVSPLDVYTSSQPEGDRISVYLDETDAVPLDHSTGNKLFMNLNDGIYTVHAESRNYDLYGVLSADTTTHDPLTEVVSLPLMPRYHYAFPDSASLVRGTVQDTGGNPVPYARVEVASDSLVTYSDGAGHFVLFFDLTLATENRTFDVTREGYADLSTVVSVTQNDTVYHTFSMSDASGVDIALISGSVTAAGGEVLAQATVEIVEDSSLTMTGPDGSCFTHRTNVLASENVTVKITAEGYAQDTFTLQVDKGLTSTFSRTLNRTVAYDDVTLRCTVTDASGAPLTGALVTVLQKRRSVLTDSEGKGYLWMNSLRFDSESVTVLLQLSGYTDRFFDVKLARGSVTALECILR